MKGKAPSMQETTHCSGRCSGSGRSNRKAWKGNNEDGARDAAQRVLCVGLGRKQERDQAPGRDPFCHPISASATVPGCQSDSRQTGNNTGACFFLRATKRKKKTAKSKQLIKQERSLMKLLLLNLILRNELLIQCGCKGIRLSNKT